MTRAERIVQAGSRVTSDAPWLYSVQLDGVEVGSMVDVADTRGVVRMTLLEVVRGEFVKFWVTGRVAVKRLARRLDYASLRQSVAGRHWMAENGIFCERSPWQVANG